MEEEPEQEAPFEIQGPDEDGRVWIVSTNPAQPWGFNLGPKDLVAEQFTQWLDSINYLGNE
ncbi:MAG: hypothetical protein ACR2JJ_12060 [Sphingomicrobium sp.]